MQHWLIRKGMTAEWYAVEWMQYLSNKAFYLEKQLCEEVLV